MRKISLLWLLVGLSVRAFAQTADLDVTVRELTRQQAAVGQTIYLENPAIGFAFMSPRRKLAP